MKRQKTQKTKPPAQWEYPPNPPLTVPDEMKAALRACCSAAARVALEANPATYASNAKAALDFALAAQALAVAASLK